MYNETYFYKGLSNKQITDELINEVFKDDVKGAKFLITLNNARFNEKNHLINNNFCTYCDTKKEKPLEYNGFKTYCDDYDEYKVNHKDYFYKGSLANPITTDHIFPISLGGKITDEENMTVCCIKCNTAKGNRSFKEFYEDVILRNKHIFGGFIEQMENNPEYNKFKIALDKKQTKFPNTSKSSNRKIKIRTEDLGINTVYFEGGLRSSKKLSLVEAKELIGIDKEEYINSYNELLDNEIITEIDYELMINKVKTRIDNLTTNNKKEIIKTSKLGDKLKWFNQHGHFVSIRNIPIYVLKRELKNIETGVYQIGIGYQIHNYVCFIDDITEEKLINIVKHMKVVIDNKIKGKPDALCIESIKGFKWFNSNGEYVKIDDLTLDELISEKQNIDSGVFKKDELYKIGDKYVIVLRIKDNHKLRISNKMGELITLKFKQLEENIK